MRISAFFRLLSLNIRRNARNLLLSSTGIVIGIASFVFFVALGYGVRQIVSHDLLGALPVNQIAITPKSYAAGMFRFESLLSRGITEDTLARFRALPGVKRVYGKMNLKAPARAVVPIPAFLQQQGMASAFYTELVAQGIEPEAIDKKDLGGLDFIFHPPPKAPTSQPTTRSPKPPIDRDFVQCGRFRFSKKPVPVLISRRLLDLYNSTLAGTRGFPKLNEQFVRAVSFDMYVGSSAFQRDRHPAGVCRLKCRVVGVSNRAILLGISLPLGYIQRLNLIYNDATSAPTYQSVILEAHQASEIPQLLATLDKMGFTLESGQIFARKVGEMVFLFALVLTLISVIIMVIAAISIGHTFFMFVYERRYQIGLMRAIGATKSLIRRLILMEAAVVGIVSGALGLGVAWTATHGLRWALERSQRLPFEAAKLFSFPAWLPWAALGFSVLFCLIGAFFPARRAAALDPARVLTEG